MAQLIKIGIPRKDWDKDHTRVWYSDLRVGGKRINRALSIYRPKAKKMLDDLIALRKIQRHGGYVENISWFTFREKYLAYRKSIPEAKTYAFDELAIRRLELVFPSLQSLKQISPELLEEAKTRWEAKGLRPYAIAKYQRSLKTMMRKAEEWKYIAPQNWRSVKVRKDRKRKIYYDMDQFRKLLTLCRGRWRTAAMLMGRAGLRPAEVRHLEWENVNFDDRIIEVRIKDDWKPKKSTEDSPHERDVDMPKDLEAHLQSIKQSAGYVLGELIKMDTFKQFFVRLSKRAKFPGFAYAFRHSYASHLISNGCTLSEVGELMGHEDSRSTSIYSHLLPHARRTAVDRLPPL